MGSFLILSCKKTIAGNIRIQDGGKLARQALFHRQVTFSKVLIGKYYREIPVLANESWRSIQRRAFPTKIFTGA